jgi:hypothetical protein
MVLGTRCCIVQVLLLVGLFHAAHTFAYDVQIGFEDYPYDAPAIRSYPEKGFVFWRDGEFWRLAVGQTNPPFATLPFPISGKQYSRFSYDDNRCSNALGRTFSVLQVDIAEYSTWAPFRPNPTFRGFRTDGSMVVQTFTLDGVIDGYGALQDFQRFTFGPDFTNVFQLAMDTAYCAIDNFIFDVDGSNMPPVVSLSQPTNSALFVADTFVTISPTALDPDGFVAAVEFFDIGIVTNSLGSSATPPFSFATSLLEEGAHTIQACARDNLGAVSCSETVTIVVTNRGAAVVRIHQPMSGFRSGFGAPIPIQISTSPPFTNIQTVTIYDSNQFVLGVTNPTSGTSFNLLWTNAAAGSHSLQARVQDTSQTLIVSTQIVVSVILPNQAPTFIAGTNLTVIEDTGSLGIHIFTNWATSISSGPTGEPRQPVEFQVSSDNPALFTAQPFINPTGTLGFALTSNANGTANLKVVLRDFGGTEFAGNDSSTQNVAIIVLPVNDPPTFTGGSGLQVNEDHGLYVGSNWLSNISPGPPDESGQHLSVTITNNNPALFAVQPTLTTNGTLTFRPATNANGYAFVTFQFHDDGGTELGGTNDSVVQTFDIRVWPLNDPPEFTAGGDIAVLEDAGLCLVTNWATNISTGPADEADQTITCFTSVDHPAMFSIAPAVSSNGALSFQFKPNSNGTAKVTVFASDGAANSPVTNFNITAISVYDPPVITLAAPTNGAFFTEGKSVPLTVSAIYIESVLTNVEFFVDGTSVGQSPTAPFTGTWSNTVPGVYGLSVRGTDNFGAITNSVTNYVLINQRPMASISFPTNVSVFAPSPTVNVVATGSDTDGSVTQLNIFAGTRLIGGSNSDAITLLWSNGSSGTYSLVAEAIDNRGGTGRSAAVTVMIARPALLPSNGSQVLVADSSLWRYSETETNIPTGWRTLSFDDSQWRVVPAEVGFGDGDEVGLVGTMRPITAYFRQKFYVTNRAAFSTLTVSLLRDDGGVVYLNDREVFRSNMPVGPVIHTTVAATTTGGTAERTFFSTNCGATNLIDGWNIVAVEIHQTAANNADMSFDFRLLGQPWTPARGVTIGTNGTVGFDFLTVSGRVYTVLYSSNLVDWKPASPQLTGNSFPLNWVDTGPPVTDAPPSVQAARFYRVRLEP